MVAYWWYGLLLFAKINPKFCSSATDRNILYKLQAQVVFLLQANTSSRANSNNVTPPVQDEAQTKWTELLQFGITHFYYLLLSFILEETLLGDWSRKIILTGQSIRITQTHSTSLNHTSRGRRLRPLVAAPAKHPCANGSQMQWCAIQNVSSLSNGNEWNVNGMYVRLCKNDTEEIITVYYSNSVTAFQRQQACAWTCLARVCVPLHKKDLTA